jgi:hypothetical protein
MKKRIGIRFFLLIGMGLYIFFSNSCEKDNNENEVNISIGDTYAGGIVFYIDNTGKHGLIAADSDQSSGATWGCSSTRISGADGEELGTGNQNTIDIINGCLASDNAASICYYLTLNGYSDWFLPSKDELDSLISKKDIVGNFTSIGYWSSTEGSNFNQAWVQFSFSQTLVNKFGEYGVRAIREF